MNVVTSSQTQPGTGWAAEYADGTRRPIVVFGLREGFVFTLVLSMNGRFTTAESIPGFKRYVQVGA